MLQKLFSINTISGVSQASSAFTSASGVVVNTDANPVLVSPTGVISSSGITGTTNGSISVVISSGEFTVKAGATTITVTNAITPVMSNIINQQFLLAYYSTVLERTILELRNSATLTIINTTNILTTTVVVYQHELGYYMVGDQSGNLVFYGSDLAIVTILRLLNTITTITGSDHLLVVGMQASMGTQLQTLATNQSPNLFVYHLCKYVPNQYIIQEPEVVASRYLGDTPISTVVFGWDLFIAYANYWERYSIEDETDCSPMNLQLVQTCGTGPDPTLSVVTMSMKPVLLVGSESGSTYSMLVAWS